VKAANWTSAAMVMTRMKAAISMFLTDPSVPFGSAEDNRTTVLSC
jgi:hypothetical protein